MNRAISGSLTISESGRPLKAMLVVAARLLPEGMEMLGEAISDQFGHFRVAYEPLEAPADLTLLLFSPGGRLLFTEPVHRAIAGAELCLQVQVPTEQVSSLAH